MGPHDRDDVGMTMAIVDVEHARDLAAWSGRSLGVTAWSTITQATIGAFADVTGDDHWIHVDAGRAAREIPGGRTIAHGLLLSLIPALQRQIIHIRRRGHGLNYGYDRVRFVRPVACDARLRLAQTLVEARPADGGTRLTLDSEIELEGSDKPALVARGIILIMDERAP
jgi:acyl dehydratase